MPKRLHDLTVDEVSLVDVPANPHAKVLLFKRDAEAAELTELATMIVKFDAQTFSELLAVAEGEDLLHELGAALYRSIALLQESLASILESDAENKVDLIRTSISQFEDAIDADLPDASDFAKALEAGPGPIRKALRLPTAAELDMTDPLTALNHAIDTAADALITKMPDRFATKAAARGAVLAANPDARQQLEALQDEAMTRTSRSEKKEVPMFKIHDVIAATAGAQVNLAKARDALDNEFDEVVRKAQRSDETFAQAYSRLLDSDLGREFYTKRFAFRGKAAAVSKIAENALRSGRLAPDHPGLEKGAESRDALEKRFDEFVAANRRDGESHEAAYARLLDSPEGCEFYRKRAVA